MTMSTEQKKIYDQIVADADNPEIAAGDVLHRMTKLGHVINGDERQALHDTVHSALQRRPPGTGIDVRT